MAISVKRAVILLSGFFINADNRECPGLLDTSLCQSILQEIQGDGIHTKTFESGRWTVIENMTQVRITASTLNLSSLHTQGVVHFV